MLCIPLPLIPPAHLERPSGAEPRRRDENQSLEVDLLAGDSRVPTRVRGEHLTGICGSRAPDKRPNAPGQGRPRRLVLRAPPVLRGQRPAQRGAQSTWLAGRASHVI